MRKLTIFNFMSLDGYFTDPAGDTSWHVHDPADRASAGYAAEMLALGDTLLFGRVTYEFMAGFWPTPMARQAMPEVADGMNRAEKIVFSRTLTEARWANTARVERDVVATTAALKQSHHANLTVLGSGTVLRQLADAGLIDEYQLMIDPVLLGAGRSIFEGVADRPRLSLLATRKFSNGAVLLTYRR